MEKYCPTKKKNEVLKFYNLHSKKPSVKRPKVLLYFLPKLPTVRRIGKKFTPVESFLGM